MPPIIRLSDMSNETSFAPLGVLGYCLTRSQFLAPVWAELALPLKTVTHAPQLKLQDVLVSILSGCRALAQVNTRLAPDVALARAWGRPSFAEQSTLARTLDAFAGREVAQLRAGCDALYQRQSYLRGHDFAQQWLWLDIDLTPLPISKHAEGSSKGKFAQRNDYGRQLARVHAPQYHETLFSCVYPGHQESSTTYRPTLSALERLLQLTPAQKQRTICRSDAGFGSDANINHALTRHWQVLTKNKGGGRRPLAWAGQVAADAWQSLGNERWVARAVNPPTYVCPTQCLVFRWPNQQQEVKYSVIISSITAWSMAETIAHYDDRGQCETEIQADKGGLRLERRRKQCLAAQEALILLTDLAHNLLAWLPRWMFLGAPYTTFGPTRLIEDVLTLPGQLFFGGERLLEVRLNRRHPYAEAVALGLAHLLAHFGHP